MGWTEVEAIDYIKKRLGHPMRNIELDKGQYCVALKAAMKKLSAARPILRLQQFNILEGVQSYNLTPAGLNLPYGKGVTDVMSEPVTSPSAVYTEFEYYKLRQPPYVDMTDLVMDKMYYKELGLLTGTEFDWEWVDSQGILLLTPSPTRSRLGVYEYNHTPTELSEVHDADHGWVVEYALALCKEMLGRVRGKFDGIPGTEIDVNTDHAALLSEAAEMMSKLEEGLSTEAKASWIPPIIG